MGGGSMIVSLQIIGYRYNGPRPRQSQHRWATSYWTCRECYASVRTWGKRAASSPLLAGTIADVLQFEPSFTGEFRYGNDYLTADPSDGISRPALIGVVYPDDGDTPFLMQATGIQYPSAELGEIVGLGNTSGLAVPYGAVYSVWTPTFRGGSDKYAILQNSIFVASETVSSSPNPGEFFVGMKISMVLPTNTTVVIGQEFP